MQARALESRCVTTGKDIVNYIVSNNLEDEFVAVGCQGYVGKASDEEVVIGFDGFAIMIFDSCFYDGYCD